MSDEQRDDLSKTADFVESMLRGYPDLDADWKVRGQRRVRLLRLLVGVKRCGWCHHFIVGGAEYGLCKALRRKRVHENSLCHRWTSCEGGDSDETTPTETGADAPEP